MSIEETEDGKQKVWRLIERLYHVWHDPGYHEDARNPFAHDEVTALIDALHDLAPEFRSP